MRVVAKLQIMVGASSTIILYFISRASLAGLISCCLAFFVFWFRLAIRLLPFWQKTLPLSKAARSEISAYFFAPKGSFDDQWISAEARMLLPELPEIRRRILPLVVVAFLMMAFGFLVQITSK